MTSSPRTEATPEATPAPETSSSELSFLYDLTSAPCFRSSALTGLGGGAAIGALNLQRHKDPMRAAETMVKAGCGVALLSWVICRKKYYDEREMTYGTLETARRRAAAAAAERAREMRERSRGNVKED